MATEREREREEEEEESTGHSPPRAETAGEQLVQVYLTSTNYSLNVECEKLIKCYKSGLRGPLLCARW